MKMFKIEKMKKYSKKVYIITFLGLKFRITKKNKNTPIVPCCDIKRLPELLDNGTKFPHMVGIIISSSATIGKNCVIYQNVTIGARSYEEGDYTKKENFPMLGNNVTVYAGAVIVGPIHIGNNAVIGANAVVTTDIPDNAVAVGVPAKVTKIK